MRSVIPSKENILPLGLNSILMVGTSLIVNFLSLFIPAMIGVVGSYIIYWRKQAHTRSNLREAFLAELRGTEFLERWPDEDLTAPIHDFLSRSVYDSNSANLGMLESDEVSAIVQYYTLATSVQDYIEVHASLFVQSERMFGQDTSQHRRRQKLAEAIDKLELARLRAILYLQKARGQASIPEAGDRVSDFGERIEEDTAVLKDFGFAKEDDQNNCIVTEDGAEFFDGEVLLVGLGRKRDTLNRERGWLQRKVEYAKKCLKFLLGN